MNSSGRRKRCISYEFALLRPCGYINFRGFTPAFIIFLSSRRAGKNSMNLATGLIMMQAHSLGRQDTWSFPTLLKKPQMSWAKIRLTPNFLFFIFNSPQRDGESISQFLEKIQKGGSLKAAHQCGAPRKPTQVCCRLLLGPKGEAVTEGKWNGIFEPRPTARTPGDRSVS